MYRYSCLVVTAGNGIRRLKPETQKGSGSKNERMTANGVSWHQKRQLDRRSLMAGRPQESTGEEATGKSGQDPFKRLG